LRRQSLLAIFQFPFRHARDRLDVWRRPVCAAHERGRALAKPVTVRFAGAVPSTIAAMMPGDSSGASRRMYRSPLSFTLGNPIVSAASLGFLAFLGAIGARAVGANVLRCTARVIFSGPWRRSRKEDAHAEARDNRRGRRSSGSPLHYVLFALPPVTSRRMPGVISFTPPARDPVER
jgi:hypothetical protein